MVIGCVDNRTLVEKLIEDLADGKLSKDHVRGKRAEAVSDVILGSDSLYTIEKGEGRDEFKMLENAGFTPDDVAQFRRYGGTGEGSFLNARVKWLADNLEPACSWYIQDAACKVSLFGVKNRIDILYRFGPHARDAVPRLSELAREYGRMEGEEKYWHMVRDAVEALGKIGGEESVSALIGIIKTEGIKYGVKFCGYRALEDISNKTPALFQDHIPFFIGDLEDEPSEVVSHILGNIGKPAVPALIKVLGRGGSGARREAARALGAIGSDAGDAVPALYQFMVDKSEDLWHRSSALDAIRKIGGQNGLLALLKAMSNSDMDNKMREGVAYQVGRIDYIKNPELAYIASPFLVAALGDPTISMGALSSLLKIESHEKTRDAVPLPLIYSPVVKILLNEENFNMPREDAALLLGKMRSKDAVPHLINVLVTAETGRLRSTILNALKEIGLGPEDAKPEFYGALAGFVRNEKVFNTKRRAIEFCKDIGFSPTSAPYRMKSHNIPDLRDVTP